VAGEAFEMFSRDILECIKALWGNVDFAGHLLLEPECHYADADQTLRVFFDIILQSGGGVLR
jgi:Plavaka transposase